MAKDLELIGSIKTKDGEGRNWTIEYLAPKEPKKECCGECLNKYAMLDYENPDQCVDRSCACHSLAPSGAAR